MQDDSKCV